MRYISTRYDPTSSSTTPSSSRLSFREAVLAGWAADGGMLLPERIPQVTPMLREWRGLTYPQLVTKLLALFMQDDDDDDGKKEDKVPLEEIVDASFACFATPEVVTFKELPWPSSFSPSSSASSSSSSLPPSLHIAELFHGPSLAFKDLGMQVLTHLLNHYLSKQHQKMTFLVGTSGDTGPSAAAAVIGKERINLVVLYPLGRVSPLQEAQMLAAHERGGGRGDGGRKRGNVRVVAVEGTSDDLDEPIAELFQDQEYR